MILPVDLVRAIGDGRQVETQEEEVIKPEGEAEPEGEEPVNPEEEEPEGEEEPEVDPEGEEELEVDPEDSEEVDQDEEPEDLGEEGPATEPEGETPLDPEEDSQETNEEKERIDSEGIFKDPIIKINGKTITVGETTSVEVGQKVEVDYEWTLTNEFDTSQEIIIEPIPTNVDG